MNSFKVERQGPRIRQYFYFDWRCDGSVGVGRSLECNPILLVDVVHIKVPFTRNWFSSWKYKEWKIHSECIFTLNYFTCHLQILNLGSVKLPVILSALKSNDFLAQVFWFENVKMYYFNYYYTIQFVSTGM